MTAAFPVQPAPGAGAASADAAAVRGPVAGPVVTGSTPATGQAPTQGADVVPSQAAATLPLLLGALAGAERSLRTFECRAVDGCRPSARTRRPPARVAGGTVARAAHSPVHRRTTLERWPGRSSSRWSMAACCSKRRSRGRSRLAWWAPACRDGPSCGPRPLVAALESMDDATAGSARPMAASAAAAARNLATDTLVGQLQTAADVARHGTWRFDLSLCCRVARCQPPSSGSRTGIAVRTGRAPRGGAV